MIIKKVLEGLFFLISSTKMDLERPPGGGGARG